jgi:outer membrane protein assembly factor BamB
VILTPSLIAGSPELVLLGVQDGTTRAVDAVTGLEKWQHVLAPVVQATAAGMFKDFGGAFDYVLIGTRDGAGDNAFFALDPKTGIPVNSFNNGGGVNGIGIISGGASVDYPGKRVYFASRKKVPGSNGTLWCLTLTGAGLGGLCPGAWPVDVGDIDGSPVLRNGVIYVGNNVGLVHAVKADGTLAWAGPFNTGDGPVKGFLFPDRNGSALYFATTKNVWGIVDAGASASLAWSTQLAPGATPPLPSIVVWNPGSTLIHVGGSDGNLYQIDFSITPLPPTAITSATLGDGLAVVGAPTLDRLTGIVYVGSDEGVIYAVQTPLP